MTRARELAARSGSVIQTVQQLFRGQDLATSKAHALSTSSATYANILSASITPKLTGSKILVYAGTASYNGATQRGATRVTRNGTEIDANKYSVYDSGAIFTQYHHEVLDAHGVTAGTAITYAFQGRSYTGTQTNFGYGDGGGGPAAFITLMEIAP